MKPHPQADILRAIADGKKVQMSNDDYVWIDADLQCIVNNPKGAFRIKQETININPQVLAHPAPTVPQNKGAILIERLLTLTDLMRNTADYMLHCPDPAPQHAQELFGAASIVGKWIEESDDDWK